MSDLRALIEAAKVDGPSAAARAKVWAGVSNAIGFGATLSSAGAATGSAGGLKMLVVGTLLGGAVTVGVSMAVLYAAPSRTSPTADVGTPAARAPSADAVSVVTPPAPELPSGANAPIARILRPAALPVNTSTPAIGTDSERRVRVARTSLMRSGSDDALAREASLLAKARDALIRRDALTALQIVRGLHDFPTRQLVPEELAIEAQALRAIGLHDEADAVDATLHLDFPDSVLGR